MIATNRRVPIIAVAASLLLIVAWYVLAWSPETKSISKAHQAQTAAEKQVTQLQSQIGQLRGLVKQVPADNARFTRLQSALPDSPQLDQSLNLLHAAAAQTGVVISSLAPSAPQAGAAGGSAGGVPAITLTMSVQGNYAQVKAFLSALETLPRTLVVDKLSLSGGTTSTASISARIFYAGQPTP